MTMRPSLQTIGAIGLLALLSGCTTLYRSSIQMKIANKPAPDFTLTTADGGEVTLSHYLGRPVILNFWAMW